MRKANNRTAKTAQRETDSRETANLLKQLLLVQFNGNGIQPPRVPDMPMQSFKRNKVYTFVRTVDTTPLSIGVADTNFAYTFSLGALQDSTDFTTLFDQYRIGTCRVQFTAMNSFGSVSFPSTISTAIDYDDNTAINVSQLGEYDSFQKNSLGSSFCRTLQPRFASAAYGGALFTAFANASPLTWLDVGSPSVPYYGLKGQIPGIIGATTAIVYTVSFEVTIQVRNSR